MFKIFPINFDIDGSAAKLSGLSYAEIERVALDAVKTALLKKRKSVTETDFAAASRAPAGGRRPNQPSTAGAERRRHESTAATINTRERVAPAGGTHRGTAKTSSPAGCRR